jgi:surfeit locus 1 family protein
MVSFRPGWLLTLFVAVFLPVFISLGVWQLNRAEQKTQLQASIAAGRQVQLLTPGESPPLYQHVQLTGRLDSRHLWLLDNRTHQGQAGYEVWVPLVTDDGWYLASAGWVAAEASRLQLPRLDLPNVRRPWLAQVRPLSQAVVLADSEPDRHWPQVIQSIDPEVMAAQLGRPTALGLLQLSPGQAGVGPVIWTPIVMTAERHRGYAVQWFAMATALLLMYLYAGGRLAKTVQHSTHKEDIE